jgi:hypothetical protein
MSSTYPEMCLLVTVATRLRDVRVTHKNISNSVVSNLWAANPWCSGVITVSPRIHAYQALSLWYLSSSDKICSMTYGFRVNGFILSMLKLCVMGIFSRLLDFFRPSPKTLLLEWVVRSVDTRISLRVKFSSHCSLLGFEWWYCFIFTKVQ